MKKGTLLSGLALFLIFFLAVIPLIISDSLQAADISEEILDEYYSLLDDSKTALEEGNHLEAKKNLDEASLLLWNNSPLRAENVTLIQRQPKHYGDIVPVEDKTYHSGDKLFLYLEPKNYFIKFNQEGKYQMDIVVDTKLIFEDGTILFHEPEFIRFQKEGSRPNRETNIHMSFNLGSGMDSGEYIIKNTISDKLSDKQIEIETKFDFVN